MSKSERPRLICLNEGLGSRSTEAELGYKFIAIGGLYAIGRNAPCSLCGERGAAFMQREWGYPPIGVAIADTPAPGMS